MAEFIKFLQTILQAILWRYTLRFTFVYFIIPVFDWIAVRIGLKRLPKTTGILLIFIFIIVLFQVLAAVVPYFVARPPSGVEVSFSQAKDLVLNKKIKKEVLIIQKQDFMIPNQRFLVFYDARDGTKMWTFIEPFSETMSSTEWFDAQGYNVSFKTTFPLAGHLSTALHIIPQALIGIGFLWLWIFGGFRTMMSEWGVIKESSNLRRPPIYFNEIGGMKNTKDKCRRLVRMLQNTGRYEKLRAHMPKGALIRGKPGTGKTMLAIAIATEAKVPYFYISGASFRKPLVGLGPETVNNFFNMLIRRAPCVGIIDEIDSAIPSRERKGGLESSEIDAVTNTILSRLDEIEKKDLPILIIGLTNRYSILDEAAIRPGRFDYHMIAEEPDQPARREIMRIHLTKPAPVPLDPSMDLAALEEEMADITAGLVGADLANLVNEASIIAADCERKEEYVMREDFINALPFILTKSQASDIALSPREKEKVRWHEAGHGYSSRVIKHAIPTKLIFAEGHGLALGITILPSDLKLLDKSEYLALIKVALSGYLVEKVQFGEPSSGSSTDIERATDLARHMVFNLGMGPFGPIAISKLDSEAQKEASKEVQAILRQCEEELMNMYGDKDGIHYKNVAKLAQALDVEKILTEKRIREIIGDTAEVVS